MIFGFNTDIKHDGTVYHVQSEAREHELLLQTQVFVRGRCIGKHAVSYADKATAPASLISTEKASCAINTAWCSMPSAMDGLSPSSIGGRDQNRWAPPREWVCGGGTRDR